MSTQISKAAILWTGGQDSCLALFEAEKLGYEVENLITFIPIDSGFRAHPSIFIKLQAEAIERQHFTLEITDTGLRWAYVQKAYSNR